MKAGQRHGYYCKELVMLSLPVGRCLLGFTRFVFPPVFSLFSRCCGRLKSDFWLSPRGLR